MLMAYIDIASYQNFAVPLTQLYFEQSCPSSRDANIVTMPRLKLVDVEMRNTGVRQMAHRRPGDLLTFMVAHRIFQLQIRRCGVLRWDGILGYPIRAYIEHYI